MKFRVQMKDPDTLHDAIEESVGKDLASIEALDDDDREVLAERRCEAVQALAGKWFRYGEYLTVEIDTDAKTCVVVEAGNCE